MLPCVGEVVAPTPSPTSQRHPAAMTNALHISTFVCGCTNLLTNGPFLDSWQSISDIDIGLHMN